MSKRDEMATDLAKKHAFVMLDLLPSEVIQLGIDAAIEEVRKHIGEKYKLMGSNTDSSISCDVPIWLLNFLDSLTEVEK